jgi:hypothetical protein
MLQIVIDGVNSYLALQAVPVRTQLTSMIKGLNVCAHKQETNNMVVSCKHIRLLQAPLMLAQERNIPLGPLSMIGSGLASESLSRMCCLKDLRYFPRR